jgi:hypothetical protein
MTGRFIVLSFKNFGVKWIVVNVKFAILYVCKLDMAHKTRTWCLLLSISEKSPHVNLHSIMYKFGLINRRLLPMRKYSILMLYVAVIITPSEKITLSYQ